MCHCSNLYHLYNNNYDNNCLVSYSYHSNHDCFVHTQLHTMLTEFLLLVACFVLNFYMRTCVISLMKVIEVKRSGLRLLENSIAITCFFVYCVHSACGCFRILVYPFFFLWNNLKIVGTFFYWIFLWLPPTNYKQTLSIFIAYRSGLDCLTNFVNSLTSV